MSSLSVLRIPIEDSNEAFILAQLTSAGSRVLDVKLVATEGQAPYTVKLKHKNIEQLRANNSPSSPDEWESILTAVLYNHESVDGVEAVAKIHDGQSIVIIIRRRVEGVNQKLGTLALKRKDDEAIDTLEWCSEAVLGREKAKADLAVGAQRTAELESAVRELKGQLDELIKAKKADETEMLEKFRDLLNEKKVKIREQQQQLSAVAGAGPRQPLNATPVASQAMKAEPESSPAPQPKRRTRRAAAVPKPAASTRSKRKAAQAAVSEDDGEEDDSGFEKMDVDPIPTEEAGNASEDQQSTDDDETGSDSVDDAPPPLEAGPNRRQSPAKDSGSTARQPEKLKGLPPSRALPFALGKKPDNTAPKAAASALATGDETESDDDEL